MHGRPRLPPDAKEDPNIQAQLAKKNEKAAKLMAVTQAVLKARARGDYGAGTMQGASAVLEVNPDVYTLWTVRREALHAAIQAPNASLDSILQTEMEFVRKCLRAQPKSYAAWHHRRWVVEQGLADLPTELRELDIALSPGAGDPRNFHAWKYRYWLVHHMGRSDEAELEYATSLLQANRSNFSAWHYRSLLLPRVHSARRHRTLDELLQEQQAKPPLPSEPPASDSEAPVQRDTAPLPLYELRSEFDFVKEVLLTNPGDASAWGYYRWLLASVGNAAKLSHGDDNAAAALSDADALLSAERTFCESVAMQERSRLDAAIQGKAPTTDTAVLRACVLWPVRVAVDVSEAQRALSLDADYCQRCLQEEEQLLRDALELDPRRAGMYLDQIGARKTALAWA